MEGAKGISIPVDPNVKLSTLMSPNSEKIPIKVPYSKLIGSLQFLANVTRFAIALSVNMLNKYLQHPGIGHWNAAKRALRYLKKTSNDGISYKIITQDNNTRLYLLFGCRFFKRR
ncbi:hypothetical protein ACFW04_013745 [Cataglyphis niger]